MQFCCCIHTGLGPCCRSIVCKIFVYRTSAWLLTHVKQQIHLCRASWRWASCNSVRICFLCIKTYVNNVVHSDLRYTAIMFQHENKQSLNIKFLNLTKLPAKWCGYAWPVLHDQCCRVGCNLPSLHQHVEAVLQASPAPAMIAAPNSLALLPAGPLGLMLQ